MEALAIKPIENENLTTELASLEGVYECPVCNGHFMVDSTFLEQVGESITCMYCKKPLVVTDLEIGDEVNVVDDVDCEDFHGRIIGFKSDNNNTYVMVEDADENVWDVSVDSVDAK